VCCSSCQCPKDNTNNDIIIVNKQQHEQHDKQQQQQQQQQPMTTTTHYHHRQAKRQTTHHHKQRQQQQEQTRQSPLLFASNRLRKHDTIAVVAASDEGDILRVPVRQKNKNICKKTHKQKVGSIGVTTNLTTTLVP
jgi:hypothetical protein